MTHWTFDLRSSDSDIEDEEQAASNNTPQISQVPPVPADSHTPPQLDTHDDIPPINPQDQTAKELDELFGVSKDEESVNYKPNPWSIARMNANARAAGWAPPKPKQPPAHNWRSGTRRFGPFGRQNVWKKSGFLPRSRDRGGDGGGGFSPEKRGLGGHRKPGQLRDSISAALRRNIVSSPTKSAIPEMDTGSTASVPETDCGSSSVMSHPEIQRNIPAPAGSNLNDTPSAPLSEGHSHSEYGDSNAGAYIPQNSATTLHTTERLANQVGRYPPTENYFDSHRPTSDSFALPPISNTSHKIQETSTPALGHSINRLSTSYPAEADSTLASNSRGDRRTGPAPQRDQELPKRVCVDALPKPTPKSGRHEDQPRASLAEPEVGRRRDWISQRDSLVGSSCSATASGLEPSPTLQLIAKYAAPPSPMLNEPTSTSNFEPTDEAQCAGGEDHHEQSPTFASAPRSPVAEPPFPGPSSKRQHQQEAHTLQTPKRSIAHIGNSNPSSSKITSDNRANSTQWQPITPPRQTPNRSPMVPMKRFDPDDKPFWSTLPTPKSAKQSKSIAGVTSARFQLPGVFLGGSPLGANSARTKSLYKPPPRKRPRSPEDDSQTAPATSTWKLTRIS